MLLQGSLSAHASEITFGSFDVAAFWLTALMFNGV